MILTKETRDNGQKWIFCPYCGSNNRPERRSCFNCETSLPRSKGQRSWYESPFWGPLTIAIIGAFIVLFGQFATIVLPVYLGPDVSDFSLICDPSFIETGMGLSPINPSEELIMPWHNTAQISAQLSINSVHPLRNYTRQVYVKILKQPGIWVEPNEFVLYAGQSARFHIMVFVDNLTINGTIHPMVIQGIGEDGKKRDCTVIIKVPHIIQ